jgi:hypothetical protein
MTEDNENTWLDFLIRIVIGALPIVGTLWLLWFMAGFNSPPP